jgi:CubicO group peptidase (beta-lactamase class C family)
VPGFRSPLQARDIGNHDLVAARIAAEPPWFEDDQVCYHAFTFGFLMAELIQRASGQSYEKFIADELTGPLGADFLLTLETEHDRARAAEYVIGNETPLEAGSLQEAVANSFTAPFHDEVWYTPEITWMANPAGGGMTNAAGMGRIGAVLSHGGTVDGRSYLSPELAAEAFREQHLGVCPMLGDLRMGLGLGLEGPSFQSPTFESLHWGGYGGSWCFMDNTRRLTGAYAMNKFFTPDEFYAEDAMDMRMTRFWSRIRETF